MEYKIKQEHNSQNSEPKDTTLWSMDTKGKVVKVYQDTTIFDEDGSAASIEGATPLTATRYAHYTYPRQHDRSARFTGKPYDEDLQAYIFPYRNYDATTVCWRSSDPVGYPDGVSQHFYACVPTVLLDRFGLDLVLVGQGGSGYGSLSFMAANTYARSDGKNNTIVNANNGAEAITAMNNYAGQNGGKIDVMQVFAHSGSDAIYFDMGQNTASSLYIAKPNGANSNARSVSDINGSYFDGNSDIKLWGCNTLNGDNNIASAIGEQTGNNVTGASSGTYFSSIPDGPYDPNFSARYGTNDSVYLVPHGEWDTVIYSPMEK